MTAPQRPHKQLVSDIGRIILVHVDLLEHDMTFGVDLFLTEGRSLDHLGEDLGGQWKICVSHLGPIRGVLLGCECVVPSTDRVECLRDVVGAHPVGAFEEQVLQEVAAAGFDRMFVSATGVHPDRDGCGVNGGHVLRYHTQTLGRVVRS